VCLIFLSVLFFLCISTLFIFTPGIYFCLSLLHFCMHFYLINANEEGRVLRGQLLPIGWLAFYCIGWIYMPQSQQRWLPTVKLSVTGGEDRPLPPDYEKLYCRHLCPCVPLTATHVLSERLNEKIMKSILRLNHISPSYPYPLALETKG
jgi:hypothetical protein